MKKIYAMFLTLTICWSGFSQENKKLAPISSRSGANSLRFAGDVIIDNNVLVDQRNTKVAVAFNGWLYSAFTTVNPVTNSGGITIRYSKDDGATWNLVDQYLAPNIRYNDLDITVAGSDTNSIVLYLAGIRYDIGTGGYILFVDRYDGKTGVFIGSNFNYNAGTRKIYDVALTNDYELPSVSSSPYSVGMLYSTYGSSMDSIIFIGSTNGGSTFNVRQTVATTGYYFGKVSISYGKSASASNGRFFGAWELRNSSTALNSHIYTSRSASTVSGTWITPKNLDSVSTSMINLCRNPKIATQYLTTDNDSNAVSAVVLVERDYSNDGSDLDVLGFYNKRAHFTDYWYRFDVINTGEMDQQPDIAFNRFDNKFYVTYFDSTNKKLPVVTQDYQLTSPSTWTSLVNHYNDDTVNIANPGPAIRINPSNNQSALVWSKDGSLNYGIALFDAEYNSSSIGISENKDIVSILSYPNPANQYINLEFNAALNGMYKLQLMNMLGENVIGSNTLAVNQGANRYTINTSSVPSGFYQIILSNNQSKYIIKCQVIH